MRILADENIPAPLVYRLRERGHDILFASEVMTSAPDEAVLDRAIADDRVLMTFDGDFGRMIFAEGHAAPVAVIFIRTPPPTLKKTIDAVCGIIERPSPMIDGYFVSIDRTARYHPLPRTEK